MKHLLRRQQRLQHQLKPRGMCLCKCLWLWPQRLNYYCRQRAMLLAQRTQK
jgi:hypothetical protein